MKENQTAPKINEYSKKLLEEKNANKDPVYKRLYNMRASKDENSAFSNKNNPKLNKAKNNSLEKNKKLKNKSTSHHSKNISAANNTELESNEKQEKEEFIYKSVNTEENIARKSLNYNINNINVNNNNRKSKVLSSKLVKKVDFVNQENNNNANNLNKKAEKAKDLHKSNSNKNINFKNPLENNSNKYIFNKYTVLFRNCFEELFTEFINCGYEMDYTKGVNIDFLLQLFYRLKLFDLANNANNQNENMENERMLSNEEINIMLKPIEKNLFLEIFENLRDSEGFILIDHFYIFSLAILDLLDYYILKAYQDKERESEKDAKNLRNKSATPNKLNNVSNNYNNDNKSDKNVGFIIDKNVIEKINAELKSKIILSKKYGGYDDANNYIITFEQSKKIHKDFLCFSTNWYKSIRNNKNKNKEIDNLATESITFKPKINAKSAKIGEEYRRKVINALDAELKDKKNQNSNNLDYIEILNLKKKKQEK